MNDREDKKKEIRVPISVVISILIAALGFAGWMSKISFDTGAIKGDISTAIQFNAQTIKDHEERLRTLERGDR